MRPGAHIKAGVEVLEEILGRHRPAAVALSDWGKSHRFAGSGDRAAIGNLVYDALRRKRSLAAQMGSDGPRAVILAAASRALGISAADVIAAADGSAYAMEPLTEDERAGLSRGLPSDTAAPVLGDFPDWLEPSLHRAFGERAVVEAQALALRAPVDLRVNTLKADRERVMKALARFSPSPTPFSPLGVRLRAPEGAGRNPNVENEAAHGKGWYEVQDEGSQIAALMAGAGPRQQVLDPRNAEALGDFEGKMDRVIVDAPCTGSGVWRRRPDAKWRLSPQMLEARLAEQRAVLDQAARLVNPGGRLLYITCSVLPSENRDQVDALINRFPEFGIVPWAPLWEQAAFSAAPPQSADRSAETLLMTPRSFGTDGFFLSMLQRK